MDKVDFEIIDKGGIGRDAIIRVKILDPELFGNDAKLIVENIVDVQDSRAVNHNETFFEQSFYLQPGQPVYNFKIPARKLNFYTYKGEHIHIELNTRIIVNDSILFDTKATESHDMPLGDKPKVAKNEKNIIEPKDIYNFFANLKAIPSHNQAITLGLLIVGSVLSLLSILTGAHDQFVSDSQVWFFSQVNSDGESQSPLVGGLTSGGLIGAGMWIAVRYQLRKYMKLKLHSKLSKKINPGIDYPVEQFFSGKARTQLNNITLRIVACNMECGQYIRGSGSNQRTVSFREPIRGIILFQKKIRQIPANTSISHWFKGDKVRFDDMFRTLYPPLMPKDTHGIDVHWEIQLLHPEFVDQELKGPKNRFQYEDFLNDELSLKL